MATPRENELKGIIQDLVAACRCADRALDDEMAIHIKNRRIDACERCRLGECTSEEVTCRRDDVLQRAARIRVIKPRGKR